MGRINSGINATSGGAPLGSAVYFVCRHMLYGHCYLPIHFPLLDAQNKQILTPPPVGAASPPDSGWGLRHTLPPRTAASAVAMLAGYHARPRPGSQVV